MAADAEVHALALDVGAQALASAAQVQEGFVAQSAGRGVRNENARRSALDFGGAAS